MSDKPLSVDEIMGMVDRLLVAAARGESVDDLRGRWDAIRTELEKLTVVEPVAWGSGLHAYVHECNHLEWIADCDRVETGGGCDACESGSDDPSDWTPLYRAVKS